MSTVRRTSRTTLSLIAFVVGIVLLKYWCSTRQEAFFSQLDILLRSRNQIGGFHPYLLSASYWLLLIASGIDAICRENSGAGILVSFGTPLLLTAYAALWVLAVESAWVNVLWFWLLYYVGLMVCAKIKFNRLSGIKGAGSPKIMLFLTTPPSKNIGDTSALDGSVLYIVKLLLALDWFALLFALAVFCIQSKLAFGG